jgi:carbamoyl-phosphate synthase large subunit
VAYDEAQLREVAERGIKLSPVHEVLVDMSLLGWKEYELEVMRDSQRQLRRRLFD